MYAADHYLLTVKSLLRRLDYLPPWLAIALGICLSLGAVLVPASSLVCLATSLARNSSS